MSLPPLPWSEPGYARVFERVQERAGFLPPTCVPAAEDGIRRAMTRSGISDLALYLDRLAVDSGALDDVITELTIGETYFFRTPEHFDFLKRVALPELQRLRGPEHIFRVWSAGCSTGEEAYSLAVTLMLEGYEQHMQVFATDISRASLERAREGRYGAWSLRGEEAERMLPFLRQQHKSYILAPDVRERVRFSYLNLAVDTWPSRDSDIHDLDVIFCRNVFIYFNRPTIEAVARRFHESLSEGGFLITGPSDPPLTGLAPFEPLRAEWGVAWRRVPAGDPRAAPPALPAVQLPTLAPLPARPVPSPPPVWTHAPPHKPSPPPSPTPVPKPAPTGLENARQAMARGDWHAAAQLAGREDSVEAAVVAVRALANEAPDMAVTACAEAAAHHPLSIELRYLEAVLLLGQGRLADAERAIRQVLYLEPSLAVGYLTLGHVLRRTGDTAGALRAFRATERLCAARPPEEPLPLAEGEHAGALAAVARAERERLETAGPRERG